MTWEELWSRFAAAQDLAPSTLQGYQRDFGLLLAHLDGRVAKPSELRREHLNEFYRLQKRQVSLATAGQRLRSVLVLLSWAERVELLLVNPGQGMRIPKPRRPLLPVFTPQQMVSLLAAPSKSRGFVACRDRALMELLYGTGMRAGEVCALRVEDIDLTDCSLQILVGKGACRRIPFGFAVRDALSAYLDWTEPERRLSGETALFLTVEGERLTPSALSFILAQYGKALGLKGVNPHAFRRTLATHLLQQGADIAEIAKLLGHRDINSTLSYAQVLPHDLMEVYRQFHPRGG